jgi:hypothetical protein
MPTLPGACQRPQASCAQPSRPSSALA